MNSNATLFRINKTIFVTFLLVLGMGVASAVETWQTATQAAPGGNPNAPLNTGINAQSKQGSAGFNMGGTTLADPGRVGLEIGQQSAAANDPKKGFLPPRLTSAQRDALTPASLTAAEKTALRGLTIFNTTTLALETYDGVGVWFPGASTGQDGPAFSANLAANQTTTANAFNRLTNFTLSSAVSTGFNTGDFNPATGVFAPRVAGKYLFTAGAWSPNSGIVYIAICKNGANPSSPGLYQNPNCKYTFTQQSGSVEGNTSAVIFDLTQGEITSGANTFSMWVYTSGTTLRGDNQPGSFTFFSGTRVGNPVSLSQQVSTVVPPQNAVIIYNGAVCPAGFTLLGPLGSYTANSGLIPLILCLKN